MQTAAKGTIPLRSSPDTQSAISAKPRTVAIVQTQAENAGAQEIARQLGHSFELHGWRARNIFFYRRTDAFDAHENTHFCARSRPATPFDFFQMVRNLYMELRCTQPDVVITLQHYGNVVAAPIARLAGVPKIIANQFSASQAIPASARIADWILGAVGFYDWIVVNSTQTSLDYRDYPKRYIQRLKQIDHGFSDRSSTLSKHAARLELRLPQESPLLGCAARLHPLKRTDTAIRLLTRNGSYHLALAGQGEQRQELQRLAETLGVADRVHFLGELNAAQMSAFLAAIDCFVFPSVAESFGLAPAEAAQAGVPVIANDIPVLREVLAVEDSPCALFVNCEDTEAFATAVGQVLDTPLGAELATRGRQLIKRYPMDRMVQGYLRLMEPTHE